jgi:hypothetical protein
MGSPREIIIDREPLDGYSHRLFELLVVNERLRLVVMIEW